MGGILWVRRSRFRISKKGGLGGVQTGEGQTGVLPGWTSSGLRSLKVIYRIISTNSGIGCHQAATFRHRSGGWTSRRRTASMRPLGIPTVSDRIAQMVVKRRMELLVEPIFHADSYGYRPGKSAMEAVGIARERCWQCGWVLDIDIKGFFDTIDHELLMRAVRKHVSERWVVLYIERWLKAPVQMPDGTIIPRSEGTPQGGVISPLLANLFLHYAFDKWMQGHFPTLPFERYADDVICHCVSEKQARYLMEAIERRMVECRLKLNMLRRRLSVAEMKTGVVTVMWALIFSATHSGRACQKAAKENFSSDFSPAVSNEATKAIRREIRSWNLHQRTDKSLEDLAQMFNPVIRGWINYYGGFYKSAIYRTLWYLDRRLSRWASRKCKRLRGRQRAAQHWLRRIRYRQPNLCTLACRLRASWTIRAG